MTVLTDPQAKCDTGYWLPPGSHPCSVKVLVGMLLELFSVPKLE
jgi:hypothetical protein